MMTVGKLIKMLERYPENAKIVVQPDADSYCYSIDFVKSGRGVRSYWGSDYEALVLRCGGQVGAVWDLDELDIEED